MKIVSLLPSATEIVCHIGLGQQLVGVSHECDFPQAVTALPKVTQTLLTQPVGSSADVDAQVRDLQKVKAALYSLDLDAIHRLQPDLIVTQSICDVCAVAEEEVLAAVETLPCNPLVVNLSPTTLDDIWPCMLRVGEAAGAVERAQKEICLLKERVATVGLRSQRATSVKRTILLEWIDPLFCAGHWNPELVQMAGGNELLGSLGQRSERVTWDQIRAADPEALVIACCGYSTTRAMQDVGFLKKQPGWESLACVQSGSAYVVDGSAYFNRPGPRLVDSLEVLASLLHPELHARPIGLTAPVCIARG